MRVDPVIDSYLMLIAYGSSGIFPREYMIADWGLFAFIHEEESRDVLLELRNEYTGIRHIPAIVSE